MGTVVGGRPDDAAIVDGEHEPPAQTGGETSPTGDDEQTGQALGPLLDEKDETEVAKMVQRLWKKQESSVTRRKAQWKANRLRRKGKRWVRVVADTDTATVWVAPSSRSDPTTANKTERLIRRIIATILVDPPLADCEPGSDDDQDRDAAQFSTRILNTEDGAPGLSRLAAIEDALDKGATYGSGFVYVCVDPHGNGHRPVQVEAHPAATSLEPNPLVDPASITPESPDGVPTPPFVKKYALEDGSLSEEPAGAKLQWLPSLRRDVLSSAHVRFLPVGTAGIESALGVVLCYPCTLGELRGQFEDPAELWSNEKLAAIVAFRPENDRDLMPAFMRLEDANDKQDWKDGAPPDDAIVFPFVCYYRGSITYPFGAYVVTLGDKFTLHRQKWAAELINRDGQEEEQPLPIPVAQFRHLDDHQDGDPYGTSVTQRLGELDEIRATQIGAAIEYSDRFNHPNTYLPLGSVIQPGDLSRRDGTPILYNAEAGQPVHEQIPQMPAIVKDLIEFFSSEMDSESGLEQTAQGVSDPSVQSGRHAMQVIEQALVAISDTKRNSDNGFVHLARIELQLYRAFYTLPQLIKYDGDGGEYRVKEWTRSDLGGTADVKIQRGTSTMMSQSAKLALAREELELGLKFQDPQAYVRYQRVVAGNVNPKLGLEEDATVQRVRKQIATWSDGPPADLTPFIGQAQQLELQAQQQAAQQQAIAQQTGGLDPNTGQPMAPVASPPSPMQLAGQSVFKPLSVDVDPQRAAVRYRELAHAMEGSRFDRQPPEWQNVLVAECERMRQAAGIATIAEQQAAAMQQQQQQAAEQGEQLAHASSEKQKDRDAATRENAADRSAQLAAQQARQQEQSAIRPGVPQ
jgi:hypothetical protein